MNTCENLRALFHVLLEGEAEERERAAVHAHLAVCVDCRGEFARERALNRWLLATPVQPEQPARPGPRRRWFALAGLAAALVIVWSLLPTPRAYGSIQRTSLLATLTRQDGASVPLEAHNHLELTAPDQHSVRLAGHGLLALAGPAVLELDRIEDARGAGWKLVLLRGTVELTLEPGARVLVTSVYGERELGAGRHVARLEPRWFACATTMEPVGAPSELLARGHALLFQDDDPAAAAPLYAAARAHPSASADERCQAHFYEWAARARRDEPGAFALGEEFLALWPEDEGAAYVRYFQGLAHARAGRADAARAAWSAVLAREGDTPLAECARAALAGL
jgi:hypothetical protein